MINQAIFRSCLLRLECPKQRFFCAQNLNSTCRLLRQIHQRAGVGNQPCANKLANHMSQIGRDSHHTITQILRQTCSVLRKFNHTVCQLLDVVEILVCDIRAHGNLRRLLHLLGDLLGQHILEVGMLDVLPHAHFLDDASENQVVADNFGQFWEMPSIPLAKSHRKVVQLLVQIIQEPDSLDDHRIDLIRRELQLEPRQCVSKPQRHGLRLPPVKSLDKVFELCADSTNNLVCSWIVDSIDTELLLDNPTQSLVHHPQLILNPGVDNTFLQKLLHRFAKSALNQLGSSIHRRLSVFEALKSFKGYSFLGFLWCCEAVIDRIDISLQNLVLLKLEKSKASSGFQQQQHLRS
mmetsp:Transcript_14077/g.31204  ORF Transcript_14077/g.31204 Transcript_14077/m.31204 type:complete len:350 (-) Transcript_14077:21-1070(-)